MLAIPHEAVKEFNLEKDTKVEIDTDKKRGMIIIYIEKENE